MFWVPLFRQGYNRETKSYLSYNSWSDGLDFTVKFQSTPEDPKYPLALISRNSREHQRRMTSEHPYPHVLSNAADRLQWAEGPTPRDHGPTLTTDNHGPAFILSPRPNPQRIYLKNKILISFNRKINYFFSKS